MSTTERKAARQRELDAHTKRPEHARLNPGVKRTLALLVLRYGAMSDDGLIFASLKTIARARGGVAESTVKLHLAKLVAEGFLVKNPGGLKGPSTGGRPINAYTLLKIDATPVLMPVRDAESALSSAERSAERSALEVLRTEEALRAGEHPSDETTPSCEGEDAMDAVQISGSEAESVHRRVSSLQEADEARSPGRSPNDIDWIGGREWWEDKGFASEAEAEADYEASCRRAFRDARVETEPRTLGDWGPSSFSTDDTRSTREVLTK